MSQSLIFWNSESGNSDGITELRQEFPESEVTWKDISQDIDLNDYIRDEQKRGCKLVVAAGGDGTVNALVNVLLHIDAKLRPDFAIVPLGTANDFAGTLGISGDVTQAAQLIRGSIAVPTDVVHLHGNGADRYFANIAAGGNCVRVSEATTDEVKSRWGALSYIRGAIGILPDMQTYRITARCDDEEFADLDSWALLVANGRTNAGGIAVAPLASTTDGLMDVIIIRDGDIQDMAAIVAENLLGNFLDCEQVLFRQCKTLDLRSDPPMRFTVDGEIVDAEPSQFSVIPGAIRMHRGISAV